MIRRAWLPVVLLLSTATWSTAAPSIPADLGSNVVISIAAPADVYRPSEFPLTGRSCSDVLSELRTRESFLGEIQSIYQAASADGRCFNLEGKAEQVAVVCCAPGPTTTTP